MTTKEGGGRGRRGGFTLIELLVVFMIIALLVATLLVAVAQATKKAIGTQARNDVAQMETAVASFKVDFNNVPYLPSQIILCKNLSDYASLPAPQQAVGAASQAFLLRAFGRRLWNNGTTAIQWDGYPLGTTNGPWILYADQSLVFWLGGITSYTLNGGGVWVPNGATLGFSTDPTNPANFATSPTKKGPYFDFKSSRMIPNPALPVMAGDTTGATLNGFYRYADPFGWGVPYLYFSSYKAGNDYGADFPPNWPAVNPKNPNYPSSPYVDINPVTLTQTVFPYYNLATSNPAAIPPVINYLKPNGLQILCAGQDGVYGYGGPFNPASGVGSKFGLDDMANFSASLLGGAIN